MKNSTLKMIGLAGLMITIFSCKSGPFQLLKPSSPHQLYEKKLVGAGLDQTSMGALWIEQSKSILKQALAISLPYQENGYFSAQQVQATALRFTVQKGQQVQVKLNRKPIDNFKVYVDLWQVKDDGAFGLVAFADTLTSNFETAIDQSGTYLLRLQPELLVGGEYHLSITALASLAYPLKNANRKQIQSLFGVGRDNNARKHEGIDIFAPFRTPVIAVSAGTVTAVNQNNLGGKVVWFRPQGKNFTLYYAHLDEQSVSAGQVVAYGDTLGRMGNTGNAASTPPHLHFGIYTNNGAVDPLPFIDPLVQVPPKISAVIDMQHTTMRSTGQATWLNTLEKNGTNQQKLAQGTIVRVLAATDNYFKAELPNGETGYISARSLLPIQQALSKYKTTATAKPVYDLPDTAAAVKLTLKSGQTVEVLGSFSGYRLIRNENKETGWISVAN